MLHNKPDVQASVNAHFELSMQILPTVAMILPLLLADPGAPQKCKRTKRRLVSRFWTTQGRGVGRLASGHVLAKTLLPAALAGPNAPGRR